MHKNCYTGGSEKRDCSNSQGDARCQDQDASVPDGKVQVRLPHGHVRSAAPEQSRAGARPQSQTATAGSKPSQEFARAAAEMPALEQAWLHQTHPVSANAQPQVRAKITKYSFLATA